MGHMKLYCGGTTDAARIAARILGNHGAIPAGLPDSDVTDVLLDIPSFNSDGNLRSGDEPEALFSRLSPGTRIWGGKLRPDDRFIPIDLLKDSEYLAQNAAITADCALKIAAPLLTTTWKLCRVLIIGWGRIGKHLSKTLKGLGANVSVCARKPSDRALLTAFGYHAAAPEKLPELLGTFDLILNTAPAAILGKGLLDAHPGCIPIDLASVKGLDGKNVITARGLPARLAPRASGRLIADTILRCGKELI